MTLKITLDMVNSGTTVETVGFNPVPTEIQPEVSTSQLVLTLSVQQHDMLKRYLMHIRAGTNTFTVEDAIDAL